MDHTSSPPVLLKWVVWTSDNTGEFVKAHKVLKGTKYVSFIKETPALDVEVARYELAKIQDYKLVE